MGVRLVIEKVVCGLCSSSWVCCILLFVRF